MFGGGRPRKPSDNTKFYELLGVDKSASADDLKRAYKKCAIKNHPDKGGDPEKFKEISAAYEVLSDPEKRQIYDEYGEDALKEGGPGGMGGMGGNPFDIFENLFGGHPFGGGGGRQRGGRRKGEDVVHPLKVSLEELYNGTTKKLSLAKNVICNKCDGKGSKSGNTGVCKGCHGNGMRVQLRQIAPGMVQQLQSICPECRGQGQTISEKDRCPQCRGEKVVQEKKILEVNVEKGMQHNQKIVFQGEADEAPDSIPGDIIFVVQQKEHPVFKRKGADLFVEKTLTLSEALCGFKFTLAHLDGRQLLVSSNEGDIVKPGQFKVVYDEGMPHLHRSHDKGRLFVHFDVKFPEPGDLSDKDVTALAALLPPRPPLGDVDTEACEDVALADIDVESVFKKSHEEEDDEDDGQGRQRVQCAQQ